MAFRPNDSIGPYTILEKLGEGGMGEVYKARDMRLDRMVAIKTVKGEFNERFEREAKSISALNHPNICTLHDIGEQAGVRYLVMEYIEGAALKGPLGIDESVRVSIDIASALDAAHRQDIIHRDLKPANILLTKNGAKVLDFGLAKISKPPVPAASEETLTAALTGKGVLLGTVFYMAPEQIQGKDADARSDIFSFGCVLYELLTGSRAFGGQNIPSVIASVLAAEPPPVSKVQPLTPPGLERVVKRCLAKDPDDRWQTARDLLLELRWLKENGLGVAAPVEAQAPAPARKRWLWPAVSAALASALIAFGAWEWTRPAPAAPVIRFSLSLPEGVRMQPLFLGGGPAVSPDGKFVVLPVIKSPGGASLYLRRLSAAEAGPIPGTEGGIHPFWSPDSRAIGFFSEGKMKRIDVAGGPARIICDVLRPAGAAWHRDGFILFAAAAGPIQRVAESGGQPAPVTKPGSTERVHEWPSLLPDGKRFLYVGRGSGIQQIFAGSLDGGAARKVLDGRYVVKYVRGKGRAGYLLETRPPSLFAVPVKEDSLEPVGEPEVLLDNVESVAFFGGSAYSFSETGLLVFTPGTGVLAGGLEIVDRAGKEVHAPVRGSFAHAEFSPDGTRVAVDTRTAGRDVALVDLVRGTTSRFTFDPAEDWVSVWSPDSSMIYFISTRGPKGTSNIYRKPASGAGREELFLQTDEDKHHMSVSADNKLLMFESTSSKGGSDLWTVPIAGPERKPQPYLTAPYNESQPAFSPDGKFAAYVSDESGRNEVFVQNFPAAGGKWQISTNGGIQPRWRRDGKELVYMAADGMIMSVETTLTATTLQPGIPKALFDSGSAGVTTTTHFTMTPDAKTFGMHNRQSAGGGTPPVAVLNWLEGLGQKR